MPFPFVPFAIFEPLRVPAYFALAELDGDFGAVRWPNGADFAPEALHVLADPDYAGTAPDIDRALAIPRPRGAEMHDAKGSTQRGLTNRRSKGLSLTIVSDNGPDVTWSDARSAT